MAFLLLLFSTALAQAQGVAPIHPAPRNLQAEAPEGGSSHSLAFPSASPRRSGIIFELRDDLKYIAGDRTFYALAASLVTVPFMAEDLLEREPLLLNRSWSTSATADGIFEMGEVLGNGLVPAGASAVLYTTGKLAHAPALSTLASDLLRGHAINALLTHAIKRSINRARPDGSPYSYPSGHTSSTFAAAGIIAHAVGPKWGLIARGGAVIVGLSRLQENMHFASDVVAGAIVGTYVASAINKRQVRLAKVSLAPWSDGRATGAVLSLRLP